MFGLRVSIFPLAAHFVEGMTPPLDEVLCHLMLHNEFRAARGPAHLAVSPDDNGVISHDDTIGFDSISLKYRALLPVSAARRADM